MSSNDAIGGYFELELNDYGSVYHDHLVALNSGRNAFEYILIQKRYTKVYVPYYTCEVILQPLKRQNIDFDFYYLNNKFYPIDVKLKKNEALLYVNYFGIMNHQTKYLSEKYPNLIVDNSQAFFERPLKNINTFYSPRKFFGLPDGGFASCETQIEIKLERDNSINRMEHLMTRIEKGAEAGYEQFKENDKKLDNLPVNTMSYLTERLMRNIRFEVIRDTRKQNFTKLHNYLRIKNKLTPIIEENEYEAPMIYPFLKEENEKTRKYLIKNKIYTATYWPNLKQWLRNNSNMETNLQKNLIAVPTDQRYSEKELELIISFLKE